jgi:peroxiredoxin
MLLPSLRPPRGGLLKLRLRAGVDKTGRQHGFLRAAAALPAAHFRLQSPFDCAAPDSTIGPLRAPDEESPMTIKVGDQLPAGALSEFIEVETAGCTLGPNDFKVDDLTRGKKVVLFGLPGAFTPTCSAKHVPSYVANYDKLKAKGVDDVLCMSVNDAFVMGAWAKDLKASGKVRMMGDGSAAYTKALGLELDLVARNMGVRCQRFSALIEDGVVKTLNIEAPGKYEVSGAETMLTQLG